MVKWKLPTAFANIRLEERPEPTIDEVLALHLAETRAILGAYMRDVRREAVEVGDDNAALEAVAKEARLPIEVLRQFEAGQGPTDPATLSRIFHAYDALTERIVSPVFHVTAALGMFDLDGLGRG